MYHDGNARDVAAKLRVRVARVLFLLDAATCVEDLEIPGFRLHELSGKFQGFWSITVSANWRVTFRFAEGNVHDVDLVDYH